MSKRKPHGNPSNKPGRGDKTAGKSPAGPAVAPGNKKGAERGGAIWLYGLHAVESALKNQARTCHRLLVSGGASETVERTLSRLSLSRPAPEHVEREKIDQLVPAGAVHQGVALQVAPLPEIHIEDLIRRIAEDAPSTLAVIDQGTDPRNVGAVLRSAAAFGINALLVQDRHAPEATGAMAKAASGALEIVPMVRVTNLARSLDQLKDAGYWTVGLAGETDQSMADLEWPKRSVIVLGAEDTGLRRLTRESCDFLVRIPMRPNMESLNLSNAAAIAFYESFKAGNAS